MKKRRKRISPQGLEQNALRYLESSRSFALSSYPRNFREHLNTLPQAQPDLWQRYNLPISQFRNLLVEALKTFSYDHHHREKVSKSPKLYYQLKKKRLLKALLKSDTLIVLKAHWEDLAIARRAEQVGNADTRIGERRSLQGHSVLFHRKVLKLLLRQALALTKLAEEYRVDDQWLRPFRVELDKRIALEFAASFPTQVTPTKYSQRPIWKDLAEDVQSYLEDAGGIEVKNLSIEIASIISSLPECLELQKRPVRPPHVKYAIRDERKALENSVKQRVGGKQAKNKLKES